MHRILLRVQAWHHRRERTSGEWVGIGLEGWAGTTGSRPEMTTQLLADSEAEPPVTTVSVAWRLRHWLSGLDSIRSGCVMGPSRPLLASTVKRNFAIHHNRHEPITFCVLELHDLTTAASQLSPSARFLRILL